MKNFLSEICAGLVIVIITALVQNLDYFNEDDEDKNFLTAYEQISDYLDEDDVEEEEEVRTLSTTTAQISDYLDEDRNFLLSGYHAGTAWYVDKNSVEILQNTPDYQIAVTILTARYDFHSGEIQEVVNKNTAYYSYDTENMKMYVRRNEKWHYLPPVGSLAETGNDASGEMAFYIAYGEKFYGGRKWRDSDGEMKSPNFGEEIYTRIEESD